MKAPPKKRTRVVKKPAANYIEISVESKMEEEKGTK